MRTPCYGCDKRHAECHCVCPDYKAFRAEKEKQYAERRRQYIIGDTIKRPMYERIGAWQRRKGRRG